MSERLSALDATFLELEDADRSAHMQIGGRLVFDGEPPTLEAVQAQLLERLQGLPRYGQRLSGRTAGGLRRPVWKDDPDFDEPWRTSSWSASRRSDVRSGERSTSRPGVRRLAAVAVEAYDAFHGGGFIARRSGAHVRRLTLDVL